jgi:hypothetical protein
MHRLAILALMLFCLVCGGDAVKPHQLVTIYARDPRNGLVLDSVSVWKRYQDKGAGVVGVVHDGDRVYLVRQVEDAALIQIADGVQGWVSIDVIKELR